MNISLVSVGMDELLPITRTGDEANHVSSIIRSLCLHLGHFEDTPVNDATQTRWELGSAFERAIIDGLVARHAEHHPDRFTRLGELTLDGLIGTPDLADLDEWAIIELKLTWLSSRHDVESDKFWKYWVQLKAYCRMVESCVGYLHVAHVNGDYRNRDPIYNRWRAEFTRQELAENWSMLKTHHEILVRDGR